MSAALSTLDDFDLHYVRRLASLAHGFRNLSLVSLVEDVAADGGGLIVPAGSVGTIVLVLGEGDGYVVEFAEPAGTLVSVTGDQIRTA